MPLRETHGLILCGSVSQSCALPHDEEVERRTCDVMVADIVWDFRSRRVSIKKVIQAG